MKKLYLVLTLLLTSLIITNISYAQNKVTITYTRPPLNELRLSHIWDFELKNQTNEEVNFYLFGTLKEKSAGLIATGTTMSIKLNPNEKRKFKINELSQTPDISYPNSDPRYKESLIKQGKLPTGDYTVCVIAKETGTNEEISNDECFEQEVEKFTESEITLLSPGNNEEISLDQPIIFIWKSASTKGQYKIKIVEIKADESPENAMLKNKAFFEKEGIATTTFQYPSTAPKFEEGKKYGWRISLGNTLGEVFVFNYKLSDPDEFVEMRDDLKLLNLSDEEIERKIEDRKKILKDWSNIPKAIDFKSQHKALNQTCSNGDFENGFTDWLAVYGFNPLTGSENYTNNGNMPFGSGLIYPNSGIIASKFSIVSSGNDPNIIGLPQVSPFGGNSSVKLGNQMTGAQWEKLSQTFIVDTNTLNLCYMYAYVGQIPTNHVATNYNGSEPYFMVRVLDQSGNILHNLLEVGNPNNPGILIQGNIVYRPWRQVQVSLPANLIGQNITIEFINADCSQGGHWGYAYIDGVCGICPSSGGMNTLNSISPNCTFPVNLCGSFNVPSGGTLSSISWYVYQNGSVVANNTVLNTDPQINTTNNTYCLSLTSTSFPGSPDGYDIVTVADFNISGGTMGIMSNTSTEGFIQGQNNDFFKSQNCNPCSNFNASADINSDLCCLKLNLNQPVSFANLKNIILTPLIGSFVTPITNFNSSYSNNLSITTVSSSNITISPKIPNPNIIVPTNGSFSNLFNLCITPDQYNISKIEVSWNDLQNNVICKDTITVNCIKSCIKKDSLSINCKKGGGYQVKHYFKNISSFPISGIEVVNLNPPGPIVNPSSFSYSPDIPNDGTTQGVYSFDITNVGSNNKVCIAIKYKSPDTCCYCFDTLCLNIPNCECDTTTLNAYITNGNSGSCCYDLILKNLNVSDFDRVDLTSITPGVYFTTANLNTGWLGGLDYSNPTNISIYNNPFTGNIPIGSNLTPLRFCLSGYTTNQQTIVVNWIRNNNIACSDTIKLNCSPPPPPAYCTNISDEKIICNANNTITYKFRITNYSSSPSFVIRTAKITFLSPSLSDIIITNDASGPLNITSGGTSDIITVTIPISNGQFCFQIGAYDGVYPTFQHCCITEPICRTANCSQSCTCDTKWDFIEYSINGVLQNPAAICGQSTINVSGLNSTLTFNPNSNPIFKCLPTSSTNCGPTYSWTITTSGGAPVANGSGLTWNYTSGFPSVGNYVLTVTPSCLNIPCNPCKIKIKVTGESGCNCSLGNWHSKYNRIKFEQRGVTLDSVIRCKGGIYNIDNGSSVTLSPNYLCPPNCSQVSYSYRINGGIPQTSPWTISNITSNQSVTIYAKCGDKICDSCRIELRPIPISTGCSCQGWQGSVQVKRLGSLLPISITCNTTLNQILNSGTYLITAPSYNCGQNCTPQIKYEIYKGSSSSPVMNGTYSTGVTYNFSGLSFGTQTYKIKFLVTCPSISQSCLPCEITIKVGGGIIINTGGGFSLGNLTTKNSSVRPNIFNPTSTLRPDFKWESTGTFGKEKYLRLIEVNPNSEVNNLIEIAKDLSAKEPVFDAVSENNELKYPKEMADLKSESYYVWVVYETDSENAEIIEAGFFKAGSTTPGKEIIDCNDCPKLCSDGICWKIGEKCFCF